MAGAPAPCGRSHRGSLRSDTAESEQSHPQEIRAKVYRESTGRESDPDLGLLISQKTWFIVLLLVMAVSFFMLLTLDSDYASALVSAASEGVQVSCFGSDGESNTGDYWSVEIEGSGKSWRQDQRVRLRHIATGGYLHSHNKKYQRIAGGQQEARVAEALKQAYLFNSLR